MNTTLPLPMARVIFFQGIMSTFYQVNRMTDNGLFPASAVVWPDTDLPEIIHYTDAGWRWNPLHWLQMFITWYREKDGAPYAIWPSKVNIAQWGDIEHEENRLVAIPKNQRIAVGISRGALTTFLTQVVTTYGKARLVILEGCPDSIPGVLEYRYGWLARRVVEFFLGMFTDYNHVSAEWLQATKHAERVPKDVPMAFITSKKDTGVPAEATYRIVQALRNAGHTMVHLLVLEDAGHNDYLTGSERDRKAYLDFVEMLVKTYKIEWYGMKRERMQHQTFEPSPHVNLFPPRRK